MSYQNLKVSKVRQCELKIFDSFAYRVPYYSSLNAGSISTEDVEIRCGVCFFGYQHIVILPVVLFVVVLVVLADQLTMDPWKILPDEQARYDQQFAQLNPTSDGFLTGQQSRDFFFKSNLPPAVLAKIWELSDLNRDGRLDRREFSLAMHLIRKRIQGVELPPALPPSMMSPSNSVGGGAWSSTLPDLLQQQQQQRPVASSPPSMLGSMPGNGSVIGGAAMGGGELQVMNQFPSSQQTTQSFAGVGALPYGEFLRLGNF